MSTAPAPVDRDQDSSANSAVAAGVQTAIEFLEKLRPGGPWVLTAIIPDGITDTITATNPDAVAAFVRANYAKKNIYYSVNPTRTVLTSKAAKADIASIEFFLADLDPNEGESPEDAKARYFTTLGTQQPACTAIIDSGNGLQVLWRLAEPIKLEQPTIVNGNKVFPAVVADVEARVKALIENMGSVAGTQNIDRILRLPGTINLPNKKKVKDGRVACPTKLICFNDATCSPDDFPVAVKAKAKADDASIDSKDNLPIDWVKVASHAGWLSTVADLPMDFNAKGRTIIAHSGTLNDLNADLKRAGLVEKQYSSWSDVSFALAAIFKADIRYTREQIAAALVCDLECNQHVSKHRDEAKRKRAVERLLARSHEPVAARRAGQLSWREQRKDGSPLPSVHNAMLAITALGIECSHDTFHNKFLVGFKGDAVRHELQSVVGEVSDNALLRLRHIMSEHFGIDFQATPTREAVISHALKHCFDPVCDMLDKAEADWDGTERLESMAGDYFNCADTPLNRAFVRKMMIAAVRRARAPGCKFDNIVVLEGDEGWNKSSAWRVLAGDENFSDQSILGVRDKEVQELLGPIWIHESSDLSGMRKAEIQSVKAFASRQVDIARPAYERFVTKQPRHAINVGTTNDHEYLQSQTGNRRFWPLKVLKSIDIEKLRGDRLQLWGEAAKYERAGESITIPEELWPAASEAQETRRTTDPWENAVANLPETVENNFEAPRVIIHVLDGQERVSSSDLLTYVLRVPIWQQKTADAMRLSIVMQRAGWERSENKITIGGKQVRGFFRWIKD